MMKQEEQFAKADLSVFKTGPVETFCKGICKYRLFNVAAAMPNLSHAGYSDKTAKVIFNVLSRYLTTGVKSNTSIGKHLYETVDRLKFTYPALTPTESQKRRVVNQPKRKSQSVVVDSSYLPNVEDIRELVYSKTRKGECTAKFSYAVKLNHNTYKVFSSEKEFNAFKEALELVGKQDEYEYVHLQIEEV